MREYGWSIRMMYEPAGNSRVAPRADVVSLRPPFVESREPGAWGLGPRLGRVTVNAAVAREISTFCFCITCSNSAWAPSRGSFAGRMYAAGPSVFAFRIDRLLFS